MTAGTDISGPRSKGTRPNHQALGLKFIIIKCRPGCARKRVEISGHETIVVTSDSRFLKCRFGYPRASLKQQHQTSEGKSTPTSNGLNLHLCLDKKFDIIT